MSEIDKFEQLFKKSLPLFTALGDSTRQKLILMMSKGEQRSVKQLTAGTHLSRPTVSHHLKILKKAHIVVEQKNGREIFYHLQPGEYYHIVKELMDMIDQSINQ